MVTPYPVDRAIAPHPFHSFHPFGTMADALGQPQTCLAERVGRARSSAVHVSEITMCRSREDKVLRLRRTLEIDVADSWRRRFLSAFWTGFIGVAGMTAVAGTLFVLWGAAWLIGLV